MKPEIISILITPSAILFSALAATLFAYINIKTQRNIAKKRATLDIIFRHENAEYIKLSNQYFSIKSEAESLIKYAKKPDDLTDSDREKMLIIDQYLNSYELTALGIKKNLFDEDIYFDWMSDNFTHTWDEAEKYIQKCRNIDEHNNSCFCEFEELVSKWRN